MILPVSNDFIHPQLNRIHTPLPCITPLVLLISFKLHFFFLIQIILFVKRKLLLNCYTLYDSMILIKEEPNLEFSEVKLIREGFINPVP